MKIIYVCYHPVGSLGGNGHVYFPAMSARHADVLVLSRKPEKPIYHRVWNELPFEVRELSSKTFTQDVLDQIAVFKPDVVHFFGNNPIAISAGLRLRLKGRKRPGILIDFRSVFLPVGLPAVKKKAKAYMCMALADAVISPTWSILSSNVRFVLGKGHEVPFGVDLDNLQRRPFSSAAPSKFVFVGVLHPYRKLDLLIEGFARAAAQCPGITLHIYGDGGDRVRLESLAASLEGGKGIVFHGLLSQQEIYSVLCQYDCGFGYVPSQRYAMAPSLKVLEYAGAGMDVLASDTQGHAEFVRCGLGFDVFENSLDALTDCIVDKAKTPFKRERYDANLQSIRQYDWKTIVDDKLMPVYRRISRLRS